MRMVHKYDEFCELYDQGKIKPDVNSTLGYNSVESLRKLGWKIDRGGFFRKSRTASDLLKICRQSPENFETAYRHAGIDFWVIEKKH